MNGLLRADRTPGQRHYRRRGFRNGQCVAARRAETAARILLGLPVTASSVPEVADMCRSNRTYIAAMVTLIQAEDAALLTRVRRGEVSLLEAATTVRKRVRLLKAYRAASPADLAALARVVGPAAVFDSVVMPALN